MKIIITNRFILFVSIFLVLCCVSHGYAQQQTQSIKYSFANLKSGIAKTLVQSFTFADGCARQVNENKLSIYFNTGLDYELGKTPFSATCTLTVAAYKNNTSYAAFAPTKTIIVSIDHTKPESLTEFDVMDWFKANPAKCKEVNRIVITPKAIASTNSNTNALLTVQVNQTVSYTLDLINTTTVTDTVIAANPLTFEWQTLAAGVVVNDVPYWQFQLLRLYNTDEEKTTEKNITAQVNWDRALSLYLEGASTQLKLNVGEGQGYYIWRVRPIGSEYAAGYTDYRNADTWSDEKDMYSIELDGNGDPVNTFFFTDPDQCINWQHARTFCEGDEDFSIRFTESKIYANGLNQIRQTQAISQSQGYVLANEKLYDYNGFPVLSTLITPIETKISFSYEDSFMLNKANEIYSAADFASEYNYLHPKEIASNGPLSYYSHLNTDPLVPNANGYPFAITRYKADGSGRAVEMALAGEELTIGSGHTTSYEYDVATETELINLFADEAAAKNKIYKTTTIDANGIKSIQYTNQNNQLVASYLGDNSSSAVLTPLEIKGHQYTLYYYDRVGNLVRTISPKGVQKGYASRTESSTHSYATEYHYNFLGQMISKKNPDAGETKYYYDDINRLRFSQSAKQKINGTYSYLKYDAVSRLIESGESTENSSQFDEYVNDVAFPSTGTNRNYTVYSEKSTKSYLGKAQEFVRNRISYTYTDEGAYTYYSYDPHGNIKWLIQTIPGLEDKTIEYQYDLVASTIKQIVYNRGKVDEFYTQYTYDADKKLINIETSVDGKIWDQDQTYSYYKHGLLKRTEVGEDKLQGIDYTYTLQGWLKALNHPSLKATQDPGGDNVSNTFAPDLYATMLAYYDGDFQKQGSVFNWDASNKLYSSSMNSFYNGTIALCITNYAQTLATNNRVYNKMNAYLFTYDELYRLNSAKYELYDETTQLWAATDDYKMSIAYDKNGNVLSMTRNGYLNTTKGVKQEMDKFTYKYNTNTNQLNNIIDAVAKTNYAADIDNQKPNNYTYDESGNLTADLASGINNIEWTPDNKVKQVTKSNGTTISFTYDAQGNKIKQVVKANGKEDITFYVNDSKGQVLSIYKQNINGTVISLKQDELTIKGNARVGVYKPNLSISDTVATKPKTTTYSRVIGKKQYELNDHLGNVRAVFSDLKLSVLNTVTKKPEKFATDVIAVNDYYPLGMMQPGQTFSSSNYKYGFQAKEMLNEIEGNTNAYDFGARILDPRVGRWLSIDPLADKYPGESPYNAMSNNPINKIDPDGRDAIYIAYPDYQIATPIGKVGGLGHGAVLLIDNTTGLTRYYEYGRYDAEGKGLVRKVSVSNVTIGSNGKPTTKSLNTVLSQLSKKAGHGGRIEGAYVESTRFKEMEEYAKSKLAENDNPDRKPYILTGNNCGTFASDVIKEDRRVSVRPIVYPTPKTIVNAYQLDGYAPVRYDPKSNTTTMGERFESYKKAQKRFEEKEEETKVKE